LIHIDRFDHSFRIIQKKYFKKRMSPAMPNNTNTNQAYETVKDLISGRHTFRKFQGKEIPVEVLRDAFALAQLTPSNNNLQTWRAVVVRGKALAALKQELQAAWAQGWPVLPPVPEGYMHLKEAFGASFYGKHLGVGREDHEKRNEYLTQNFNLYGATTAVIVYQDSRLVYYDTLSVGLWMQNLTLTLRAQSVEACFMASITGYPTLLKKTLGLPEGVDVLSGIALGYIEEGAIENTHVMAREPWEDRVTFQL
jgi:nitroreductase